MKRTVSILLAALLLLFAVPTFAETAGLQAGLYVSEAGTELLYLDEKGAGVLNYKVDDQFYSNGVLWTEASLEIEHGAVPYVLLNDVLFFTFENTAMAFRYQGPSADYALGDQRGTAFAGTYASEDGRQLVLAADGQGSYSSSAGEAPVFWGSLMPYWGSVENVTNDTCFVLFGSYLSGMFFQGEQVTVNTENDGEVVFRRVSAAPQAPALTGELYYGCRMIADGQTIDLVPFLKTLGMDPKSIYLELRPDGTGSMAFMDETVELTWTEDSLTVDGESQPYTREGDHIVLTIEGESIEFAPAAELEALLIDSDPEKGTVQPNGGTNGLAGTWTFTKARAMGMEFPASMMGTSMALVLREDGTAVLKTNDSTADITWTLKEDGTISLSAAGTEVFTLTYDGAVLTLQTGAEGVEMIFEKE